MFDIVFWLLAVLAVGAALAVVILARCFSGSSVSGSAFLDHSCNLYNPLRRLSGSCADTYLCWSYLNIDYRGSHAYTRSLARQSAG